MLRVVALAVALTATAAAAPPYKETLSKADIAAIETAIRAALPKVAANVAECQKFLDAYNKDLEHNVEQANLAAKCYRTAGSIGAAIHSWVMFLRYAPKSPNAIDAQRELGIACEAAALFDRAADAYETFAKNYPGDKHADELMIRATCIRRQLATDIDTHAENDFAFLKQKFRPAPDSATLCDDVRPVAMPAKAP